MRERRPRRRRWSMSSSSGGRQWTHLRGHGRVPRPNAGSSWEEAAVKYEQLSKRSWITRPW